MKVSKADEILISKLQSGKLTLIVEALKDIRYKGSVILIPYLFDIIAFGKFTAVDEDIVRIIADIKEKDAVPVIVDSLQRHEYGDKTATLVAICWQSSLDFSTHLPVFIDFFLQNDFQTSFETFTVIEESLHNTSVAQRQDCLKILDKNSSEVSGVLKPLFNELYELLKNALNLSIDNSKSTS